MSFTSGTLIMTLMLVTKVSDLLCCMSENKSTLGPGTTLHSVPTDSICSLMGLVRKDSILACDCLL